MIAFNIPRRIINIGLELVHPRWRLIAVLVVMGIANALIAPLNFLLTRANISGLTPEEYLQHPHSDYWPGTCMSSLFGFLPLFMFMVMTLSWMQNSKHSSLDRRVDQTLRSLGLKGQNQSATTMFYQGLIDGRRIALSLDARQPGHGVLLTPQPKRVTFTPDIQIRMSAAHRADMSLLPGTTESINLAPNVIRVPLTRNILPGMSLLTLDPEWSHKLLAHEKVSAALRRLAPESDPNRHHTIGVRGQAVELRILFMGLPPTVDPLAQFVTLENMQQILADLRIVAEAAESLPPPAYPGLEDNAVRILAADPMAFTQLIRLVFLVILSACWLCFNISSLLAR